MPRLSLINQLDQAIEVMLTQPGGKSPEIDSSLTPLLRVAIELRELPRENFKASLKSDLERKSSMATTTEPIAAVRTFAAEPVDQDYGERSASLRDAAGNYWYVATYKGDSYKWEGAPDVQPYLHPLRAEPVINFLKRAFGAEELGRYATPDGVIHHATIKIGDSHMEMGEAHGKYAPLPAMFYLYVPDCDAVYRRALAAGATSISEPKDHSYGDRSGGVKDAFGNQWYIATHIRDVDTTQST